MTTAIDTNVLVALWQDNDHASLIAQRGLDRARSRGGLTLSGPVYSELLALPGRASSFLDTFFRDSSIYVDLEFTRDDWREAGMAFQEFAKRRRAHPTGHPRRILADFMIGAHAVRRTQFLVTFDAKFFRTAFPALQVVGLSSPL